MSFGAATPPSGVPPTAQASVGEKAHTPQSVAVVPDDWLQYESLAVTPEAQREVYVAFLEAKLRNIDALVTEAEDARKARF